MSRSRLLSRLLATGLALALLLSAAASSLARSRGLDGAPVLRKPKLLHQGRHGITPTLGFTFNNPYRRHAFLGLRYDYYLANWVSLGLELDYAFGFNTGLADDVESARPGFETTSFGFMAMAGATLVPLYGKFTWLGAPSARWDLFLRLSGGAVQLKGGGKIPSEFAFGPRIGVGTHIFLGDQAAIVFEVNDTLISMHRGTTADGGVGAKSLENVFAFQVGLLVHFPEKAGVGP